MTNTESDLRAALQSVVPDDIDVVASDFRARLDRLVVEQDGPADETGPSLEIDTAPAPLELTGHRRRRGPFAAWAVTAAACAAAVAGIVIAVLPGGDSDPSPAANTTVPADVRAAFFPGTIVVDTVTGSGTKTIDVPQRTVPKNYEYATFSTCSGGGDLDISGGVVVKGCERNGVSGATNSDIAKGRIVVRTDPGTTWRVTVVLQPDPRTNAGIQSPVDDDMTGPDSGVRQSGTGTSTVTFDGPIQQVQPKQTAYRVHLVCTGSGVSMPGLKAPGGTILSTRTCFAGSEYVWQDVKLTLPASVRVVAAPGTTWTIVVDGI